MRPQMKEKRGAEVNTHKTSIRSGGNLQSSLLRSASPHLGRAGNPRRRWLGIQSDPAASSSGARSLPPLGCLRCCCRGPAPPRWRPAEPGPGGGEGRRRGRRWRRSRPLLRWPPAARSPFTVHGSRASERPPRGATPPPSQNITRSAHWLRRPWRHQTAELSERREGESLGAAPAPAERRRSAAPRAPQPLPPAPGAGAAVADAGASPPPPPVRVSERNAGAAAREPALRRETVSSFPSEGNSPPFVSRVPAPRVPSGGGRRRFSARRGSCRGGRPRLPAARPPRASPPPLPLAGGVAALPAPTFSAELNFSNVCSK